MKKNNCHLTVQSIFILLILLNSNEAKRISKEKLARLLGQNPGVGFHQKKTMREEKSPTRMEVQSAKGQMFSSLDDVAKHLQSLGVKINAPKDRKMSEILNRYGVLKTEAPIRNKINFDSVRNKKSEIDNKGRNLIDNFAEQNKKFIDNPVMFHQEKMMISPKAELEFAQR